jgi:hypothetical protein
MDTHHKDRTNFSGSPESNAKNDSGRAKTADDPLAGSCETGIHLKTMGFGLKSGSFSLLPIEKMVPQACFEGVTWHWHGFWGRPHADGQPPRPPALHQLHGS